jgi:hypothetical protein
MIFKVRRAQVAVEYITLLLMILGLSAFFLNQIKGTLQNYHNGMVIRIATGQ